MDNINTQLVDNLLIMLRFINRHNIYIHNNPAFNVNTISNNNTVIKRINNLKCVIEDKLRIHCIHDMIYDDIDIDLDKTIRICYCSKCLLTFR
jgi:hypothetical protein